MSHDASVGLGSLATTVTSGRAPTLVLGTAIAAPSQANVNASPLTLVKIAAIPPMIPVSVLETAPTAALLNAAMCITTLWTLLLAKTRRAKWGG